MIVSNEDRTQKSGKNTDSSGMVHSIPLPTDLRSFPDYDEYAHDRGCTGDEGVETPDYNDYDFRDEPDEDVITVVKGGHEKEIIILKKESKRSFQKKIEDFTEDVLLSNDLFDEIDRDSFVSEVHELFDRLDDSAKEKLTDQELKTRIKKLATVEVCSGLFNDLTEEEKEELNESVQDVSLFHGLDDVPMDRQGNIEKYIDRLLKKEKKSESRQYLSLSWAGGLKDYRDQFTSVELQEKSLEWWVE